MLNVLYTQIAFLPSMALSNRTASFQLDIPPSVCGEC